MSDLNFIEKRKFEDLFRMNTGYVLDFSDRTFQEFIGETVGIDIYTSKYNFSSGSKANRLRAFWNIEPNFIVGKLLEKLLDYWVSQMKSGKFTCSQTEKVLFSECKKIVNKLKQNNPVGNIETLQPNNDDRDFSLLSKNIRTCIENNEPEIALDRLHTFVVKYIRELCKKHSILFTKDTPLHNLFGGYVRDIIEEKKIDSRMTELILKSSISVLDAFNDIRNNKSLAHDNPILNYDESLLIFNNISNVIRFLESIEIPVNTVQSRDEEKDDLPF